MTETTQQTSYNWAEDKELQAFILLPVEEQMDKLGRRLIKLNEVKNALQFTRELKDQLMKNYIKEAPDAAKAKRYDRKLEILNDVLLHAPVEIERVEQMKLHFLAY